VLLHVIETPRSLDNAVDLLSGRERRCAAVDYVNDIAIVVFKDIDDVVPVESTGIERLSTGGGIEEGAIEPDERPPVL
jgi:hypothetical protein